ncbi:MULTISPECIES: DUF3703 domain-containing protein [unclassified Sphingopyxis]|uniref:DUF3703 domain-containing protein n=1 Tax=unclassified Sphingopyxis TaxID=2614943 RepID=UPI0020D100A0|nr:MULTISPECIES: DUF3703 domain-containing protein [unclassified Sphingopyxis]HET6525500.1 DUF3703 domain-containing protein [Sphingopyxis sp.]HMO73736.1 DUF3703 domain-containing protein [Sphingopyxis sp.]HMP43568.1 DUF3703 domain-containing protein [Sphingopyxis sp.]HMQ17577.1 DUF3703 domain-containing protein [Sphingopyxis sp.]
MDQPSGWRALERAHIIAQPYFAPHLVTEWWRALFALVLRDWREVAGQLFDARPGPHGFAYGPTACGK